MGVGGWRSVLVTLIAGGLLATVGSVGGGALGGIDRSSALAPSRAGIAAAVGASSVRSVELP